MEAKYKGIDVSKWQGDINWEKVRASGVEFAMLRAGFGKCQGQNDTSFERNYREAKKNGILVGAYHYSYAKTVSDAENVRGGFVVSLGIKLCGFAGTEQER